MKKKLLIINKSFELGGIQMALANLLESICDEYDITLAIFNSRGPQLERVPPNVKLLKLSPLVETLGMTYGDCKKFGSISQKLFKVIGSVWAKIFSNALPLSIAMASQKHIGHYDVVISYHQEQGPKTLVAGFGKFALEKCSADLKIAWVHCDFTASNNAEFGATNLATKRNIKTYLQFDKIVGVSKTSIGSFIEQCPELKEKCDYCYNVIPVKRIIEKSNEEQDVFERENNTVILFSACRFVTQKGLVPALKNIAPVLNKYDNLKWVIAGQGPKEQELRALIAEHNLEEKVRLIGFKKNPYPYMREADFLFLPSLHETFGMVAGESQAVGTPVIASDIPIMREVLGKYDFLCENNDYAPVLERLLMQEKTTSQHAPEGAFLDWKVQFERIIEC